MTVNDQKITRAPNTRCCEAVSGFSSEDAQQLSQDLDILAHPIRLQILTILARNGGQICVCDLESALPIKQPTVSHHLKLLREAGLLNNERQGPWVYYVIRRDVLAALQERISAWLTRVTASPSE